MRSDGRYVRGAVAACIVVLTTGFGRLPAAYAFNPRSHAAIELATEYSPIAAMRLQQRACGPGEPFRPTVVNLVLENTQVTLRNASGRVLERAPTAAELGRASGSDYIDLPGNPLSPGCTYEREFRHWYGDRKPSVYAHVASDSDYPGRIAVQYWFYYTFNNFSDKHESDWEMAQVDFKAPTPAQALRVGPYEVDLAQHAGGERGEWTGDPKLSKIGTHPVSYVAAGSHADYFQSALYLGKGGSAIFGCDDTRNVNARLHLQTVVLPNTPVAAGSPFAWLNFEGRWGQKEAGINNGPYGPVNHAQWEHPIEWSESLRTVSLTVPGIGLLGLSTTSFFCSGTSDAATVFNWGLVHPVVFVLIATVILLTLTWMARATRWVPPDPRPLRQARGCGQILRGARRLYRENLLTFIGIGLIFLPFGAVAGAIQWLLFHVWGLDRFVALDGKDGLGTVFLALLIGGLAGAFAAACVTAAVSAALGELDAGRRVTPAQALALAAQKLKALAGATLTAFSLGVVLTVIVVGIPLAIYGFIRGSLFAQSCVLDDESAIGSLRASAELTRGRWWRTLGFTALVDILAILSGPVFGVFILLLTAQSLTLINIAGALVYAVTVPYAAVALTLYYFDLRARPVEPRIGALASEG
jgi:hypothetical protein